MATAQTPVINLNEILRQVAHEKDIDLDHWIAALEDAMASAAKKQHRIKEPVRSTLDLETGKFEAFIVKNVVEEVEDPISEWSLDEARDHKADAEVGEEVLLPISTEGLGRIAAQSAKQVLYQRIREAEREKVFDEYKGKIGDIINGTVRRFERGDVIVDLGGTEAVVPRSEQSRHERYNQGERIRGVIIDVHTQPKGPQIVISRTDPRLLVKLFEMEVPEIYDGTVIIKTAVRAPGERAKVAVISRERDVDPVGACVGMKGSRVQSIIRELRGEKIDIIQYSDDLVTFAQSALAPARITRVSITHHGEIPHLDVIVEDEQLSLAIGRRGQNVRLAAELIKCKIDIKSESDVKDEVAGALAKMLQTELGIAPPDTFDLKDVEGIDEAIVAKLEEAGLADQESLLKASLESFEEIEGVDPNLAQALLDYALAKKEAAESAAEEGIDPSGPAATSSTMGGQDFMAALSKAFQESESGEESPDEASSDKAEGVEEAAKDSDSATPSAEDGEISSKTEQEESGSPEGD